MHHRVDAVGGERGVAHAGEPAKPQAQKVAQPLADQAESEPEHQPHNAQKDGDRKIFVGEQVVELHAAGVLAAFAFFYHRAAAHPADEIVAHVGKGGLAVGAEIKFHLGDGVLHQLPLVFVEGQPVQHEGIALHQLGGCKTHGNPCPGGVVLDHVGDGVDAAVHGAGAEIQPPGAFAVHGHPHGMLDQLVDALVAGGRDGHHRDAQRRLQMVHMDGVAVGAHLVHHVEGQHHGNAQLDELHGEIEVALDVGGVHNVDDALRLFVYQKVAGDDLLAGIGREGINARQVHHRGFRVLADLAVLAVHRDPREVAHMLVGTGELVEEGGLAAVLVARQCEHHRASGR